MKQLQLAYKDAKINTRISQEEGYFYDWLLELQDAGYIHSIDIQPHFNLLGSWSPWFYYMPKPKKASSKPRKLSSKHFTVLNKLSYTADFRIYWNAKAKDLFFIVPGYSTLEQSLKNTLKSKFIAMPHSGLFISIIEVKGSFASKNNSTAITFPIIQKILMNRAGVYANKVKPLDKKGGIFKHTFTPKTYLLTEKTEAPRTISWEVRSLEQYEQLINPESNESQTSSS